MTPKDGLVIVPRPAEPTTPEDRAELHAALDRGLADVDAGRTRPLEEVLARLDARRE
ncbi:MAG TPA: hypothetical protein VGM88_17400 [Kofleriaceae bacterium]|jgi:predicted transcriptional regulator